MYERNAQALGSILEEDVNNMNQTLNNFSDE